MTKTLAMMSNKANGTTGNDITETRKSGMEPASRRGLAGGQGNRVVTANPVGMMGAGKIGTTGRDGLMKIIRHLRMKTPTSASGGTKGEQACLRSTNHHAIMTCKRRGRTNGSNGGVLHGGSRSIHKMQQTMRRRDHTLVPGRGRRPQRGTGKGMIDCHRKCRQGMRLLRRRRLR